MSKIILDALSIEELKNIFGELFEQKIELFFSKKEKTNNSKLLSRCDVAKLLKISLTTLNKYSKLGYIQSYRVGKRILYKPDEVENSIIQVRNIKNRKGIL